MAGNRRGLPGYTFERAAGELWRSGLDADRNFIVLMDVAARSGSSGWTIRKRPSAAAS